MGRMATVPSAVLGLSREPEIAIPGTLLGLVLIAVLLWARRR